MRLRKIFTLYLRTKSIKHTVLRRGKKFNVLSGLMVQRYSKKKGKIIFQIE